MAQINNLPSLALSPDGSQYDFVAGDDGRPLSLNPVVTVNTAGAGEFINISGVTIVAMTSKMLGSCLRLVAVNTGFSVSWVPLFISGTWEAT